jgi:hypothetical protein
MADLAEITTGTSLDGKDAAQAAPVLAMATAPASNIAAAAPAGTTSFLDSAKTWFGTASNNVTTKAKGVNASVAKATNDHAGLMWIILAAMVAAGIFLFTGKPKKGGKSVFSKFSGGARKSSGGSLPR